MKRMGLLLAISLLLSESSFGAVISPGDILTLEFANIPLVETGVGATINKEIKFAFDVADILDIGESFQVEYFSGSITAPAERTVIYDQHTAGVSGFSEFLLVPIFSDLLPVDWSDLQGSMRLTMLSGTVDLLPVEIDVWVFPDKYSDTYEFSTISAVPLPGALVLFCSAFGMQLLLFRPSSKRRLDLANG